MIPVEFPPSPLASLSFLGALEWLHQFPGMERLRHVPWQRIGALYIGEKLALGVFTFVTVFEVVVAANRFMAMEFAFPKPRKSVRTPKRKRGFGLKWVALALLALLPGGLVGTFVVIAVMGKDHWRRDAFWIIGLSVPFALALFLIRASFFPWPQFADALYISGSIGLIFGILQLWALIKLLREWWGEPDECVAWWPPLALWCQLLCLSAVLYRIFA